MSLTLGNRLIIISAGIGLLLLAIVTGTSPVSAKGADYKPITIETVRTLQNKHFAELKIDDALSERFLNNYIEKLDFNKAFFLQSDIDSFAKYKTTLDDQLLNGDTSAGFVIYKRFKERLAERMDKQIALLSDESVKFDFSIDETLNNNPDKATWAKSEKAQDDLWRKRVKSFLLAQKLSDEDVSEAKETLLKRYKNQKKRIMESGEEDVFERYLNAFTELYDPHTNYLSARTLKNFTINMSLSLEGIGAVLQTEDGDTKVLRLVTGGPAQKQGELQPTDVITGVGQGQKGEIVDVDGWRLDEVVDKIRGRKGSIVRLQVTSADPSIETKIISIERDKVKLEDQAAQKAILPIERDGETFHYGVIQIPTFYRDFSAYQKGDKNYRSTTRDVERMTQELMEANVDGIIIDLRNNGGGSLSEATALTDLFIEKGPVVQIGNGENNTVHKAGFYPVFRGPLVVMINRMSASASEIFAGAIQDYKRGLIVGSQSFGKGTVQSMQQLRSSGGIKITESKFYRVSGESTQHRGVLPDIPLPETIDKEKIGESSYDTALAWSTTSAARYEPYLPINDWVPPLTSLYQERTKENPDFIFLEEQKELAAHYNEPDVISLKESERIKEKQEFEQQSLAIENKKRKAKGEKVFASFEQLKEDNERKIKERSATAGTTVIDIDNDPLLKETGYIMSDYIDLLTKHYQNANATAHR